MDEPSLSRTPTSNYIRRPYFGRNSHYIVQDLCTLLQQQMDALAEGGLNVFSARELQEYRLREGEIYHLQRELQDFSMWAIAACSFWVVP